MDDKQLLERAARAAGIELMWSTEPDMPPRKADDWENWQPLNDDGDAFRLSVSIGAVVDARYGNHNAHANRGVMVMCWKPGDPVNALRISENASGDYAKATRRAIVRAAAAMAGEE